MENSHTILALNGGSSSLKFAIYRFEGQNERLLASGEAEEIGRPEGRLRIQSSQAGLALYAPRSFRDVGAAASAVFDELRSQKYDHFNAVGHRLVTGGSDFLGPRRITPEVLAKLQGMVPLAPLHLPSELELIEAVSRRWPAVPQVACFDTAFHSRMPETARRLPLPRKLWPEGLQRYGFHGLSYEYVLETLGPDGRGRLVMAHLGNGSSLAAVLGGRPMDTSMGFTPSGGVMMGTRTGDLDPGVLLYLMREKHYEHAALEKLLDHESGLLGVSGVSSDMKVLLGKPGEAPAREAIELFCYLVRKQIGAFAAVLGGLDTLVFTGGIGEHAAPVRAEICQGLEYLGMRVNPGKNNRQEAVISASASACTVRVIATNEELMIGRHTQRLVIGEKS
jgi:acetate kinase